MSAGIDIPACHSARNRTTISGNQVLCASPVGISASAVVFGFGCFHYIARTCRDNMVSIDV
jgi:hypothetical protein